LKELLHRILFRERGTLPVASNLMRLDYLAIFRLAFVFRRVLGMDLYLNLLEISRVQFKRIKLLLNFLISLLV